VRYSKMQNVTTVDLMGPLLDRLSYHFADAPSQKPGLFHKLNEAYFKRIEAMEFAIQHDDGQRVNELWQAEIILVGISRTFKTPLSIYLAFKGWFVANVPIVLDVEIPEILSHVSPERVVALITDPIRLAALRKVRQKYLKNATGNYADPEHVRREVRYAMRIFNRFPRWRRILVTNKPIEEISSEILISIADQEM
jgi:regulator of PEP synthase PpsR (kinase-PPPase family)